MSDKSGIEKQFYRVREICEMTGLSRAKVFQALGAGQLQELKLEGVLLIPVGSLSVYLADIVPSPSRSDTTDSRDVHRDTALVQAKPMPQAEGSTGKHSLLRGVETDCTLGVTLQGEEVVEADDQP